MVTVATAVRTGRWHLTWDAALYAACTAAAAGLAVSTTLTTHHSWARWAAVGYGAATLVAAGQALAASRPARWATGPPARYLLAAATWLATAAVPLALLVGRRAAGLASQAQTEVSVIERAGVRWWETGSPYLDRAAITALPPGDRLAAYTPYQPGMAGFGLPRALDPADGWWSDARIWFAVVTVVAVTGAAVLLRRSGTAGIRGWQVVAVLPIATLAMAAGGDDLPVLALCLLGLALAARSRYGLAGLAVGAAAALKLVAWPVAIALLAFAATRGQPALLRYGAGVALLPLLTGGPVLVADPGGMLESTVRFPLGLGLAESPAQAPLPGHLLAHHLPAGRAVVLILLAAAGLAMAAWLVRRPPLTAAAAAAVGGYGLLLAICLMPATRFGYLLYPVVLLAWVPLLRAGIGRDSPAGTATPDRELASAGAILHR